MGGCSSEDDLEYTSPLTLALVGKTGNGKSATGNSIVGTEVFDSKPGSFGVTNTSVLRKTILTDGRILNLIDTPGLFDSSAGSEFIEKEIVRSVNMSTNGVHAVLVVLSVCYRFSEEEKGVISRLLTLFGRRIYDHMIIVFTGGDELENHGKTLEDFLYDCPVVLKEILCYCGNRCVLFDNMTKNQIKKDEQVQQLLFLVNLVLERNGGQPYTEEMYPKLKDEAEKFPSLKASKQYTEEELSMLLEKMFKGKLNQKTEKFESMLEQALRKERDARLMTEAAAITEQTRSKKEIEKLRDLLDLMQLYLSIIFILIVIVFLLGSNFGSEVVSYFL